MSIWHLVILLVVVVVIFGTGKLRNMGSDLGSAVRDFKKGLNDGDKDEDAKREQARLDELRRDDQRRDDLRREEDRRREADTLRADPLPGESAVPPSQRDSGEPR